MRPNTHTRVPKAASISPVQAWLVLIQQMHGRHASSPRPLYRITADRKPKRWGNCTRCTVTHSISDPPIRGRPYCTATLRATFWPGCRGLSMTGVRGAFSAVRSRRVAADIDALDDPLRWRSDGIVPSLRRHSDNLPATTSGIASPAMPEWPPPRRRCR